jgi:transcriptional regulator with XRE-family HTH domain
MTQREVARRLGISRTLVQCIERAALRKLARALDLPAPAAARWMPVRKTRRRGSCSLCGERGHYARACVAMRASP